MSKILISADSTVDLSPEIVKKAGVRILPLSVNMGDDSYLDNGVEATPDKIYEFVKKTGTLPSTAAVPIGEYEIAFRSMLEECDGVIHINISSDMSSCHQNARVAAGEVGNVEVIDSRNLSTGSGHLVLEAVRMASEGMKLGEIARELRTLAGRVDASFVLDDLNYLYKGGRCTSVAKLGANILKLKPCIQVKDGKMGVGKKYRGDYKLCVEQYIKDKLADKDSIDPRRVFITHTECPQEVIDAAVETVKDCFKFNEVYLTVAGCTITSHCGPCTLGVLFFRKQDLE